MGGWGVLTWVFLPFLPLNIQFWRLKYKFTYELFPLLSHFRKTALKPNILSAITNIYQKLGRYMIRPNNGGRRWSTNINRTWAEISL